MGRRPQNHGGGRDDRPRDYERSSNSTRDNRERDHDRPRSDRDRDHDRDRDRNRRYRSRSRDRRDDRRDRDRSPRQHPRGDDRRRDRGAQREDGDRDRDRLRDSRDAGRRDDLKSAAPSVPGSATPETRDQHNRASPPRRDRHDHPLRRDNTRRRSASPIREASPHSHRDQQPLPTRSKGPERHAPMSFRVGGASEHKEDHDSMDIDDRRGRGRHRDESEEMEEEEEEDDVVVEEDGDMAAMQAMMGFGGFSTTKNTKVIGNNTGAVRKEKKTEYRQYMNRTGGFNRPLSPGR